MANKIGIVIMLKNEYKLCIVNAVNKIKERRLLYIIHHILFDTSYLYHLNR